MNITVTFSPRFKVGQTVYIGKSFGNCRFLERYEPEAKVVKDIRMNYSLASNSCEYVYTFEGEGMQYVENGNMAATKEELYAQYLEEIKSMMPQGMQDYLRENL